MANQKNLKCSVIVPAYNVAEYLSDCLNSLLNQNFDSFEIIVVNDGSTDKTAKICQQYQQQSSLVRVIHQDNLGLSSARNTGISRARGDYLAFVDGDDLVSPEFLSLMYQAINETSSEIAICDFVEFHERSPIIKNVLPKTTTTSSNAATKRLLIGQENRDIIVCNKLFKKQLFSSIKFPVGKLHEDNLTTYKLLSAASTVSSINMPLYFYRKRTGSIMAEQDLLARLKSKEEAAREAMLYFKSQKDLKQAAEISLLLAKFAYLDNIASGKIKDQRLWHETVSWIKSLSPRYRNNPYLTKKLKLYLSLIKTPSLYRFFRKIRHE